MSAPEQNDPDRQREFERELLASTRRSHVRRSSPVISSSTTIRSTRGIPSPSSRRTRPPSGSCGTAPPNVSTWPVSLRERGLWVAPHPLARVVAMRGRTRFASHRPVCTQLAVQMTDMGSLERPEGPRLHERSDFDRALTSWNEFQRANKAFACAPIIRPWTCSGLQPLGTQGDNSERRSGKRQPRWHEPP